MRIGKIITRADAIGGAQVHLKDLALALLDKGHEVMVFVGQCGPFTEMLSSTGVPYRSLHYLRRSINPLDDCRALMEIRTALQNFKPDIVTCHSSKAGFLGRVAAKMTDIPAVFTVHGWAFTEGVRPTKSAIYRAAERFAAPFATHIITVSDYDRDLAITNRVARAEKLKTVWNGMPDVSSEFRAEPSLQPTRLVMVARFDAPKNHADLLHALSGLKHLPWSLDLVGDGPLELEVRALVSNLGLCERVNFLGLRNDVPTLLSRSQIFILVSNWEGLPLSVLEAMRAELPVVASDVGGVKESVKDRITGYLVPRGDVVLLRARLSELIQSSELRVCMGRAGRHRYEKHFTLGSMVDKTLAIYNKVLQESS